MKKELSVSMTLGMKVKNFIQDTGDSLATIYSALMEESITRNQAWKILHASVAFTFAVFAWCGLFVHFLLVAWFLFTLWDCKRAGLK